MTVVLVHGVPETSAIWGPMRHELGRDDVVALSPPGFGAPLPDDFPATHDGYRHWLADRLREIGRPLHLVGHDWGGIHVLGIAVHHAELIDSWVSDAVGGLHPDYVWHDLAQTWQTPGAGERRAAETMSGGRRVIDGLARAGMTAPVAERVVAEHGPAMQRAVLSLYRSAAQPVLARLGSDLPRAARRPGLAVVAGEDGYVGSLAQRREAARTAGARVEVLDGLGHWWMTEDPRRAAAALGTFLDSVPT